MTTAELIPVLKALRGNPSTACVFADWFEERGDLYTAELLRTTPDWYAGWAVVERIAFGSHGTPPNPTIKQALIEEALSRVKPLTEEDIRFLDQRLYWYHDGLQGTLVSDWVRIDRRPGWETFKNVLHQAECVQQGSSKLSVPVMLRPVQIRVDMRAEPLCGGSLEAICTFWVGRPNMGNPVVTNFCPETLSHYDIVTIPF